MRPYQIYATEAIVGHVEKLIELKNDSQNTEHMNGYIWHTTGSGKTLTSFKTAQILTKNRDVDLIVFVVDRKDLRFSNQQRV